MKIYTKTGDKGKTSLYTGAWVAKSDQTFTALGDLDELNAHLGVVIIFSNISCSPAAC